ncbi:MAG: hypothetical protein V2A34_03380 [Lentisphaerota bacterium]
MKMENDPEVLVAKEAAEALLPGRPLLEIAGDTINRTQSGHPEASLTCLGAV